MICVKRSSFASVGVISLKVLRKWLLSLLNALNYLHNESPLSPLIHGHLQCHNILFIRSDGSVKLGGYAWLCRVLDINNYDFPGRAKKDNCVGYFPKEVFAENDWSCAVDVYALGMVIVHFLTNAKPYSEYATNEEIIDAIIRVWVIERIYHRKNNPKV
ncbi:hypothetical protein JH06_4617 [Blastocystis sp. subtype 4]|uniref:hypothetical protein n=1 Tax=Blastocystis sp. subtype 4 TaxID=944170 RepID=UPI000711D671|nr:hypothetical protein JH06_4617 [Blastocystis sp. subtype 4]KNB42031.1 hypothetical protein JH06_4617 [Blastocystis sp. subtype 4]|eukprot:XP_014525474.1 hypothetical protein JH06_4617 [Blastocystis sp. subtype 4]